MTDDSRWKTIDLAKWCEGRADMLVEHGDQVWILDDVEPLRAIAAILRNLADEAAALGTDEAAQPLPDPPEER